MKIRLFAGLVMVFFFSWPSLASDVWTPERIMLECYVSRTSLSPDSKWVAYTITQAVMEEEKSEYVTHIWLSCFDGSRSFQLTRGEKSCVSPAWSPDSRWIAFLSARSGKNNIWLIRSDGGEARQLTDVESGIGSYKWSPDGRSIAFLMPDPRTEEEEKARKAKDDARVLNTNFKFTHLYRVKVDIFSEKRFETERVTEGEYSITSFDWSPDGKSFVITHMKPYVINSWRSSDISLVSSEGGKIVPLVRSEGSDGQALYSPDGHMIAFTSSRGNLSYIRDLSICLIPASGGEVTVLPPTHDKQPWLVRWAPDSSGLYFNEWYGTNNYIFFAPADGSPIKKVSTEEGAWNGLDVSKDGKLLSFTWEDLDIAVEVYVMPADGGEPQVISDVNGHLPVLPLARSEVIKWKSFDGKVIEGILHYPLNYQEGKRYPLILNIHGGPMGVFTRTFSAGNASSVYPNEAFSAKGFFVLKPNPRGSSGYGKDFRFANIRDWGGGDYKDVMAGVDHLIDKGMVDADRLGVMGWSYGGYMTSWIITQTDRFKTAAVGAGLTNLTSFTGIDGFIPSYFETELWEDEAILRAHSAMFHIDNASTPTLILHGENDPVVPISQGYELYNALRRKGVETQMVVYPRTGHGPDEPKLFLDLMNRHLDWFSEKLLREK